MKTYEGTMTIKWYKNDGGGDRRPITIDCEDFTALKNEQKKIKNEFMTKGDDPKYPRYHGEGLPHSVTFDMHERK